MQVFKAFYKILVKRASSMIVYVIIFLALSTVMISFGNKTIEDSFRQKELEIAVVDHDKTPASQALTAYLDSLHEIVPIADDHESFTDELFARNVTYILTIPKSYENQLIAGTYDNLLEHYTVPGSNNAVFVDMQIEQYLNTLTAYLASGMEPSDALKKCADTMKNETDVTIYHDENTTVETKGKIYYSFLYLPYVFICIMLIAVGPILSIMNSKEIKNRMSISCLKSSEKNLQLGLATLLCGTGICIAFFIASYFMSDGALISTRGLLYMGNAYVLMMVAIAITYLLSQLTSNDTVLNMVANIFGLGSCFLCGVFVPLEYLSPKVRMFSKFLPPYWYVNCCHDIASYSGTSGQLQKIFANYGVLLLFAVAIFGVAICISKTRNEQRA